MERLLVTGVDGPLGVNLALKLSEHFEVLGLYSRWAVESPSFRAAAWEDNHPLPLAELVRDWRPRWIIHCGPLSAPAWDAASADEAGDCEPRIARDLAELAAHAGARLTVVSSDVVFAGPRMFHEETSEPSGSLPRAEQVRAMEAALAPTQALVVRTHAYGWSPVWENAGFAQRTLESLSAGSPQAADGLRHATPILATDLADLLERAYEMRLGGLYHLAGAERASPYRFALEMAAACGLRVSPEPPTDAALSHDDRCHDETTLNSKRARRALEMTTPMLRDGLGRFCAQWTDGWRERVRALGPIAVVHDVAA